MLKIKFWRIENVIIMKILEQGDEIKRGSGTVYKSGSVEILSIGYPRLFSDEILVRGVDVDSDRNCVSVDYDNIHDAKQALGRYIAAVRAYNAQLNAEEKQPESCVEVIEE